MLTTILVQKIQNHIKRTFLFCVSIHGFKHVFVTDIMSLTSREKYLPICGISLEMFGPFVGSARLWESVPLVCESYIYCLSIAFVVIVLYTDPKKKRAIFKRILLALKPISENCFRYV